MNREGTMPGPTEPYDPESNLIKHAKSELERVGLYDDDSGYDGMIGHAVEELIAVFADQGHSGLSAQITLEAFMTVANYENL